ncbi:MAG: hypothetical protein ACRD2E_11745 [Terriglobales bacterium]
MDRGHRKEWVLAARTEALFGGRPLQGVAAGGGAWLACLLDPAHTRFVRRAEAEEDPSWKQVIPYVILHCGAGADTKVFCYSRGAGSGEARLRALRSIGLGGHINPADEGLFQGAAQAYGAAVERELAEEVEIAAPVMRRRICGVLNDDSTPVGRVHVGVIHLWDLAAPRVRPRERQIAAAGFRDLAALRRDGAAGFETWSQLCLASWEALQAAAPAGGAGPAHAAS